MLFLIKQLQQSTEIRAHLLTHAGFLPTCSEEHIGCMNDSSGSQGRTNAPFPSPEHVYPLD